MDPSKLTALRFFRPNLLKVLIVRHYLASAHKDADGFLNDHEEDDIRAEKTFFDQADKFISILLTKDNSAFDKFCEILDEFGQQVWSQKLKDKATGSDDFSSTESDSEPDEKWINKEPSKTIPLLVDEYIRIKEFFIQTCREKGEPELKRIKSHCSDLIQAVFRDKPKYTRLEDDLDRCPSIEEIARILFFHVSRWMGFEFLDRVIEFFLPALREVQIRLRDYKAQLRPVLEEKLVKIRALQSKHPRKCKSPKGLLKLVAKYNLDKDGIYVKDLIAERHFLAEKLSVPEDLLQVISWSSGSLCIIYFTLEELKDHLLEQIKKTRGFLQLRQITSITIDENQPIIITASAVVVPQTATTGPNPPLSDSGFASGSGTNVPSDVKTVTVSDEQTVPDSITSTVAGDKDDQVSVLSRMVGHTGIMHAPETETNFVQTFVDNNSLSEHAKVIFCKERFRCRKDPRIQIDIGHLNDVITKDSPTHEGNLLISPPSLKDSTWERLEKDEATLNIVPLQRQLQASSLRMMFGQVIHKNTPGSIVLATCDKEFSGHVLSALERGWQVDLWTWDGCFPRLMNHPKCGSLLNIHFLDTLTDSIILVEEVLKPSQFTSQDLTKKLSKSGAMVRVAASVVERGSLCQPFRESLENAAHFPVMCYQVTKPDSQTGMSEFLVLFISTEGDILCPLDLLIAKIAKNDVVIPNLHGIITFENFKKRETYRCQQILSDLQRQCKDGTTTTHSVPGSIPKPRKMASTRKTRLCKFFVDSYCPRGKFCPWPHSEDKVWCPRCQDYGHIVNTLRCKYYDFRSRHSSGQRRYNHPQQQRHSQYHPMSHYPPQGMAYYPYDAWPYYSNYEPYHPRHTMFFPHQPHPPVKQPGGPSKQPGGPSKQPGDPSKQPGDPSKQSGGPSKQPGGPSKQPGDPSKQPGGPSKQPGGPSKQPGDPSKQPGEPSKQPGDPSKQPGDPSKQPGDPLKQLEDPSKQPGDPSKQPGDPSKQPGGPSKQPGGPSKQPGDPSKQPGDPSKQPGDPSKQPGRDSKHATLEAGKRICQETGKANVIFHLHVRQKAKQPIAANLSATPTVQELRVICRYILRGQSQGLDWTQIPLQLGITRDKVQSGVDAFPHEPFRAIYFALDYWRNGQGSQQPTWTSLLRALVNANFQNVAMEIEDKLKKGEALK